jgi:hypothetical protein
MLLSCKTLGLIWGKLLPILPRISLLSQGHNVTTQVRSFLIFFLISHINCATLYATDTLNFIGDVNFATGEKFQDTEIGGLSGITFDKRHKKLIAISDDKSQVNETRFYEFDLALTDKTFKVTPAKVVKLKNKDGQYFKLGVADFEGISLLGKDLLVSSEGSLAEASFLPPELYLFSDKGEFIKTLSVPTKFLPKVSDKAIYGSRINKAFEALSTSLDGKTTFLGSEESLLQDGDITTATYGSHVRIVLYKNSLPKMEIAYPLEKVTPEQSTGQNAGDNGLVDIAAVDDKTFYTMERSYLPSTSKNVIRIFKCTITKETTDVSKLDSLKNNAYKTVGKVLVADLDTFLPKMTIAQLDNIEGISFGPTLSNGHRTLIVVSDNNFNKTQRTLFMAFEITSK